MLRISLWKLKEYFNNNNNNEIFHSDGTNKWKTVTCSDGYYVQG